MRVRYFYELMNRPIIVSDSLWYELLSGPFPLEDESLLYLARPTGQMFPSGEFAERRYYIRIARAEKELIKLDEERMDDKLRFRKLKILRIADQVHNIDNDELTKYFFPGGTPVNLQDYQFYAAKIHNKKDWMDKPTIPELPDINAEQIGLIDMGLSVHAFKYLKKENINNLKKLVSLTPIELDKICHGNKKVIQELEEVAAGYGLYFVKLP